jgi:hypothetical protein
MKNAMVLTLTTTSDVARLLVRSDLPDPLAARREVERWASDQGIRVPRLVLRLRVVDAEGISREWTVLDCPARAEPPPPPSPNRFATRLNERRTGVRGKIPEFLKLLSSSLLAA